MVPRKRDRLELTHVNINSLNIPFSSITGTSTKRIEIIIPITRGNGAFPTTCLSITSTQTSMINGRLKCAIRGPMVRTVRPIEITPLVFPWFQIFDMEIHSVRYIHLLLCEKSNFCSWFDIVPSLFDGCQAEITSTCCV